MAQIKTLEDLEALKRKVHELMDTRIKGNTPNLTQIKVAMSTCGISAGSKEIFDYMFEKINQKNLDIVLTQTECMGYCNQEPTIEVTIEGKQPVIFGNVDKKRADEILDKYISKGDQIEGIIK